MGLDSTKMTDIRCRLRFLEVPSKCVFWDGQVTMPDQICSSSQVRAIASVEEELS